MAKIANSIFAKNAFFWNSPCSPDFKRLFSRPFFAFSVFRLYKSHKIAILIFCKKLHFFVFFTPFFFLVKKPTLKGTTFNLLLLYNNLSKFRCHSNQIYVTTLKNFGNILVTTR